MKVCNRGNNAILGRLILLITVAVLMLCSCGKKASDEATTAAQTTEAAENIVMTAPIFPEAICFENRFCDLYFPIEWEDSVRTVDENLENGLSVTFMGMAGEKEAPLFALRFEEGENDGSALGKIVGPEGTAAWVYLEIVEFTPDDSWNGEEVDAVYAMQECVNYVLKTLTAETGFTPA